MDNQVRRTHFYHADASAVGGRIDRPFQQILPVQAPLSLPAVGGFATARVGDFRFDGILSFQAAQTQVSGSFDERNGNWTTLVSASIEGLNILNVITADRVVAQISTEHPRDGYTPRVSFVGTQFENLRIGGCPINPVLDLGLCDQAGAGDYPKQPCIENPAFLKRVGEFRQNMRSGQTDANDPAWHRCLDWLEERYPLPQADESRLKERSAVLCSLVQEIQGDCPGKRFGHALVIPEFGKIFLGELLLDHNSFHLIMLRLEMGSPTKAVITSGDTRTNGSTYP